MPSPAEVEAYSPKEFQKFMHQEIERTTTDLLKDLEDALFAKDPEPLLFTGPVIGPDLTLKDLDESMALIKKAAAEIEAPIFVRPPPRFETLLPLPDLTPKRDALITRLFGGPLEIKPPLRTLRVEDCVITLKVRGEEDIKISPSYGVGLVESHARLSSGAMSVSRKVYSDELPPPLKLGPVRKRLPAPTKARPLSYGVDFPPPIKGS
jgi:hypothetical protein